MDQENNNLNSNNFNTQGNNEIPNNQQFNSQNVEIKQQIPTAQQTTNQTNTFETNSNQNFNNKPKKKVNLGVIIGIIVAIVVVSIIGILIGTKFISSEDSNNESQNNNQENNNQTTDETETIPAEINQYWNIDTKKFDASLFDGKFSVGGDIIKSKLTGKTLKENGYELRIGSGLFQELLWDEENNVYSDKNNGAYILKNNEELLEDIYLENYKNETSLYNDNTELSYYWNTTDKTYNDIIIPICLVENLEDNVDETLTIENIVEKLGAPTYVQGRLSKTIKNGQFFKYVYVYDDYTLWFEMVYNEKIGINVTGFEYQGNLSFNQPCKYYDADADEFRQYNNSLEYLNEEQSKYEKSF